MSVKIIKPTFSTSFFDYAKDKRPPEAWFDQTSKALALTINETVIAKMQERSENEYLVCIYDKRYEKEIVSIVKRYDKLTDGKYSFRIECPPKYQ